MRPGIHAQIHESAGPKQALQVIRAVAPKTIRVA